MLCLPNGVDYYEGVDLDEDAPNFRENMKARRAEFQEDVLREAGLFGVKNGPKLFEVVVRRVQEMHFGMFGWAAHVMDMVEELAPLVDRE